jgi:Family of unknown function (DUF5662)
MKVRYFTYFAYVVKHKWYVFIECAKIGLFWRGLVHDLSKFNPCEFFPYARMFYGTMKLKRDETGYYDPYSSGNEEFSNAWIHHLHSNKHHWQYFALVKEDASVVLFEMPKKYIIEMICDWSGASKAQKNNHTAIEWYRVHKGKILLHENSRKFLENKLEEIFKEKI